MTSVGAARRWADVTALDFVDHLLDSARRVAEVYGLGLHTRTGDAQALPFEDNSFDVVLSSFGAMFRTVGEYVPPPPGVCPAVEWGTSPGCGSCSATGSAR